MEQDLAPPAQAPGERAGRMSPRREEILVLGSGAIGLSTALMLLEAGRAVRVLEAGERIGAGASHGNCGTITPSHAPPLAAPGVVRQALRWMLTPDAPLYLKPRVDPALWRWLLRFAARCNPRDWRDSARARATLLDDSRARLADWVPRYGLQCEFQEEGLDYVFRDPRNFERYVHECESLRTLGITSEVIAGADYEAQEPAMRACARIAMWPNSPAPCASAAAKSKPDAACWRSRTTDRASASARHGACGTDAKRCSRWARGRPRSRAGWACAFRSSRARVIR